MTDEQARTVEQFRSDLTVDQIESGLARDTRSLAMQAYLHAFPAFLHMRQLTEYLTGRTMLAPKEAPLGGWVLMRSLADPSTTTVSPNVDTLYGAAYLLLAEHGPVVLSVPPIGDRYYSIALLDAYFDNFAVIGSRTKGGDGGRYLLTPRGWDGDIPDGMSAVIESPTSAVCALQRIYTRDVSEYEQLHAWQDAIAFTPLDRHRRGEAGFAALDLSRFDIPAMRTTSDPLRYFEFTSSYTAENPPTGANARLTTLFAPAGVGPGATLPDDPVRRDAIVEGAHDAQTAIDAAISGAAVHNGWRLPEPMAGRDDPNLLRRAALQMTQMGLLPLEEATYFFAYRDAEGAHLHGGNGYELPFPAGALPPCAANGFWSLTMYDERSLLVDNEIDRYVIRPDTRGLTLAPDESLTIRVQHTRPGDAPLGNWLPAPRGIFNVALRIYLPEPPVLERSWFPEAFTRLTPK